jgi:hypothetical protein
LIITAPAAALELLFKVISIIARIVIDYFRKVMVMAPTRQPLIDLVYNDETGRYIGMLETKITRYQLDDLRFRALLELLTDESWDDYQFSNEDGEIQKLAVDALKRRLGLSDSDARKLVSERWDRHNPDPAPDATRTFLVGKSPMPHTTTIARPATEDGKPLDPPYSIEKHLAGLGRARQNREAGQSVRSAEL